MHETKTNFEINHCQLMKLPVEELRAQARLDFCLLPDIPSLLHHFARSIAGEIKSRNDRGELARLILPVGPVRQYPMLTEICNRERISWKNVYTFNMDEFLDWQGRPLPLDHPFSFEGFMKREVFARLDPDLRIPEQNCFFPHPFRIEEISEKIGELGGIDCCYGGVGYHGHVAFNEPPISRWHKITVEQFRESLTRVLQVADDSIVVQSIHTAGADSAAIPPMAVTLGMKDILASRSVRLYCAAGERQRAVFRIAVAGAVTTDYPVTLIQGHPNACIFTDEATAAPIENGLH
jgi:glucosamine-6-phosphate deaminase